MTDRTEGNSRSWAILPALDIAASATLVAIVLINIWLILSTHPIIWVDVLEDDAYYYLGIARSLAQHGLFQYLPPFETNGFQPLWQAMLAIAAFVAGTSTTAMVVECYVLSAIFVALFVGLSWRQNGSALAAIVAIFMYRQVMLSGMETVLIPAFVLLFFSARGWRLRGLLGALIFLSRLDAISLVVARDLYSIVRRRDVDLRHYIIILPVAILYMVFNFVRFGVFLPISGLAKALYMVPLENLATSYGYVTVMMPTVAILAIVLLSKTLSRVRPIQLKYGAELTITFAAVVICALYYGVLSGWPLWPWYVWAPMLFTYYTVLEVIDVARADVAERSFPRLGLTVAVVVVLFFFASGTNYPMSTLRLVREAYFHTSPVDTWGRKNLELVSWVKTKKVPPGTMFAMGDRAGSFGYFLGEDYRFLQTEGLVADAAYLAAMKADQALAYVERQPIGYWVADREQYLQADNVIGVPEPVQGKSMRKGVYLICFDKSAIVDDQSYQRGLVSSTDQFERRYVFDMKAQVQCPVSLEAQFQSLRDSYGQLRGFSLPAEKASTGWFTPQVKRYLGF